MVERIKPGELEKMRAMERVVKGNVDSGMMFAVATRKMVNELSNMFDILQKNVMIMKKELDQLRDQLAKLQQQFYARGTTSYADGDKE